MAINRACYTQTDAIGHWHIDKALGFHAVVIAIDKANTKIIVVSWLGADQRDVAAKAVATEECALRTLLHLDSLKIDKRCDCLRRARLVNFIDVKSDARIRICTNSFGVDTPDSRTR